MIRSKICPKAFGHTQGQKSIENWKYCPCCGEKLQIRKCEKCHHEMDIDWIYCVKCGKGDDVRIQKKMLANLDTKSDYYENLAQAQQGFVPNFKMPGVSI